jgi:hypothetical protein
MLMKKRRIIDSGEMKATTIHGSLKLMVDNKVIAEVHKAGTWRWTRYEMYEYETEDGATAIGATIFGKEVK